MYFQFYLHSPFDGPFFQDLKELFPRNRAGAVSICLTDDEL